VADHETLLGSSSVYLFGRKIVDLILAPNRQNTVGNAYGANNFLRNQLLHEDARLARIFAFSFEGEFFLLSAPAIFLVHGAGLDPDDPPPTNVANEIEYQRLSRSPGLSSRTGLGYQEGSLGRDIRVWIYDKNDHSMRLDLQAGPLDQILLGHELGDDPFAFGGSGRSSGGRSTGGRSSGGRSSGGRSSGAMGRSSG
jgi:uncharacterized membrane protein YgcG